MAVDIGQEPLTLPSEGAYYKSVRIRILAERLAYIATEIATERGSTARDGNGRRTTPELKRIDK